MRPSVGKTSPNVLYKASRDDLRNGIALVIAASDHDALPPIGDNRRLSLYRARHGTVWCLR
jgi:hypothetical protein